MSEQVTPDKPQQFGRYLLKHLVAEGGMAEIYLAEARGPEGFSKVVALKRMLPHLGKQNEFVTMFLDEARLASGLSHPNVVQVFDFGEFAGSYYIAMEYLAGENLGQVVKQSYASGRPPPVQAMLQILVGACDGLHYAHEFSEHGVPLRLVHRDVSPSNLMVTYQGGIKVLDFGIARALGRQQENTQTGVVKGKFPYCSPEQLRGKELDRRSDVFALGCVAWELFTGMRLFRRDTEVLTCQAVLNEEALPPSQFRTDLPAGVDRIVLKALEKDRERRYATCLELRKELEVLFSGPPARLDEYMVELFGEARAAERMTPDSDAKKVPTAADMAQQGSNPPITVPKPVESSGSGDAATRTVAPLLEGELVRPAPGPRTALKVGAGVFLAGVLGLAVYSLRPKEEVQPPRVVETVPDAGGAAAAAPSPAALVIDTRPQGAAIEVAGKALDAVSPTTVTGLAAGTVEVRVTLAGYRPLVHQVVLEAGGKSNVLLPLERLETKLVVNAPEGARLFVDKADRGEMRSLPVEPGSHAVKVTLAGHVPFEATVEVAVGEAATVEAKLQPVKKQAPGALDVSCVPWCRVFVDGKDVGKPSPIVGLSVPAGSHQLRMEHPPSGRSKETLIDVKSGATVRESASFR
jgi:serine/threonine protein kinase